MKRLLSFVLAISFVVMTIGVAFSANIPTVTAPEAGPEAWLMNVYNNTGSTLDEGDIVVWDIDASTGDDYMYVIATTTADTGPIAGIVDSTTILDGEVGQIVIYGQKDVNILVGATAVGGGIGNPVTTTATLGAGNPCTTCHYYVGYLMEATTAASTSASIMVNPGSSH